MEHACLIRGWRQLLPTSSNYKVWLCLYVHKFMYVHMHVLVNLVVVHAVLSYST